MNAKFFDNWTNQVRKGMLELCILNDIRNRQMYGYEIVKLVNQRTGGRLEWKEGTLYPTLHRLLAGRYLSARWADAPTHRGPGRKRKYYAITAKGRRELARRTAEWQEFSTAVNAILLGA